jgi:hypothetical protein
MAGEIVRLDGAEKNPIHNLTQRPSYFFHPPRKSQPTWSVTFGPANIAASGLRLQTICNPPSLVGRLRESFWRRFHDPAASRCIRQKSLFLI